jgi:hypothetical protein
MDCGITTVHYNFDGLDLYHNGRVLPQNAANGYDEE